KLKVLVDLRLTCLILDLIRGENLIHLGQSEPIVIVQVQGYPIFLIERAQVRWTAYIHQLPCDVWWFRHNQPLLQGRFVSGGDCAGSGVAWSQRRLIQSAYDRQLIV